MRVPTPRGFFGKGRNIVSVSAPGRLDVMGGIADYSGSLVLEMPIRERTLVYAAARKDGLWRALSLQAASGGLAPIVEARTREIATSDKARKYFQQRPEKSWAAYVLGSIPLLLAEKNMEDCGADLYVESDVPLSKGLSSSASVEVAAMAALGKLFKIRFKNTELPLLCQRVENTIAGAPCGLMDQLTCYLGKKGRLLPILCQPDDVGKPVAVPPGVRFIGMDSGVRHWVGGSSYSEVRTAAFMGYSLIAMREGATLKALKRARDTGEASKLPFGGYLARMNPEKFRSDYSLLLPERMQGKEFLRLSVSIDPVTDIKPDSVYPVLAGSRHPVEENARVVRFQGLLASAGKVGKKGKRQELLGEMGRLMYQSHASYGACGLGEPVTDALVEAAQNEGPEAGIYGAKITGGGSGGTVCFLTEGKKGLETVRQIARQILKARNPFLSLGSSDGGKWN